MHLWDDDVRLSVRYEANKAVKCDYTIELFESGQTLNSQKKTNIKAGYYNPTVTQSTNPEF